MCIKYIFSQRQLFIQCQVTSFSSGQSSINGYADETLPVCLSLTKHEMELTWCVSGGVNANVSF